jgi:hypothetical protein
VTQREYFLRMGVEYAAGVRRRRYWALLGLLLAGGVSVGTVAGVLWILK